MALALLFASSYFSTITPQGGSQNVIFVGSNYLTQRELYRLGLLTTVFCLLVSLRANISETVLVLLINERARKRERADSERELLEVVSFLLGVWLARNRATARLLSRSEVQRQPKRAPMRRGSRGLIPKWSLKQSGVPSLRNINLASCRKPRPSLLGEVVSERSCAEKACTRRCWQPGGASGPMESSRL